MTYLLRPDWGAEQPRHRTLMNASPKGIALHWVGARISESRQPAEVARSIQRYHQRTRGWSDVAYQEMIALDGTVLEGRGFGIRSAANGGRWLNSKYGAICLLMGPGQDPSDAMIEQTRNRIDAWRKRYPRATRIVGHGDLKKTSCPGDEIRDLITRGVFDPGNPPPGELPSPNPTSGYPVPTEILRRGNKGNDVKWLQHQLNSHGFNLAIDGDFGWLTWRACRTYQRRQKGALVVDGIAGPKTISSLIAGALS